MSKCHFPEQATDNQIVAAFSCNFTPKCLIVPVNVDYLKKHKDEMTRVAASLMMGTVTPPTLIAKLQAYPKQNNLMYVLQSYGQLVKTIFICKYLLSQPLRKRINAQLNKGEQLHGLRVYLWFGGDGVVIPL
jgi:TnpA family transposase